MSKIKTHVIVGNRRKEKFSIVKWHFDQCKELGCKHEDHTPEENLAWVNEKLKTANGKLFASLLQSRKMWREIIQRRGRNTRS